MDCNYKGGIMRVVKIIDILDNEGINISKVIDIIAHIEASSGEEVIILGNIKTINSFIRLSGFVGNIDSQNNKFCGTDLVGVNSCSLYDDYLYIIPIFRPKEVKVETSIFEQLKQQQEINNIKNNDSLIILIRDYFLGNIKGGSRENAMRVIEEKIRSK